MENSRFMFRVWDSVEKEFLSFVPNCDYQLNICAYTGTLEFTVYDVDGCHHESTSGLILEQCTGLKDKNGNLIYEGDLIKSPNNSYMLEVVRMPNGVYGCKVCKISPVWEMNLYSLINAYDVEIIGNIHEQAEQKDVK